MDYSQLGKLPAGGKDATEYRMGFWKTYLVVSDTDAGWFWRVLLAHGDEIPTEAFRAVARSESVQSMMTRLYQHLLSGFAWRPDLFALEPAYAFARFIDACAAEGLADYVAGFLPAVSRDDWPHADVGGWWGADIATIYDIIGSAVSAAAARLGLRTK